MAPVFPRGTLKSFTLLEDGLCNTNYKIALDGTTDEFVLRLYVRDESACSLERDLFWLTRGRLPVPEILYTECAKDGERPPFALVRYAPGISMREALRSEPASTEVPRLAGRLLAGVASFHFPRAGKLGAGLEVESWPWLRGEWDATSSYLLKSLEHPKVKARLGDERSDRLLALVHASREWRAELEQVSSLVHGDFNRGNLLFENTGGHWRVSALLDWEWAHSGSPLMDIGNMLRDIGHLNPAFEASFIEGFREGGGELPERWKLLSLYVDLTNHCEFLEQRNDDNPFLPACLRGIDASLDRLERR